ncbi:class I lanthipeptide [Kordia sp.]|uniref:class I lanthipeptide n=1 Tax=Kordia sp. TaxID=1965332 RepID=UPI003B59E9F0
MKKKLNKHLRFNKTNVSKLNAELAKVILGGKTANNYNQKTKEQTCPDTCGATCTTSRFTVDFGSNANDC